VDTDNEITAAILEPHFDAVRDTYVAYSPAPGVKLWKMRHVHFVIDDSIRDKDRHYAACRDDGKIQMYASAFVNDLELEQMVAIMAHEFGHAADFAYPGQWVTINPGQDDMKAVWVGMGKSRQAKQWREHHWHRRSADEIEWTADAIAEAVTGQKMHYCGKCVLECFASLGKGGPVVEETRPEGLR